MTAAKAALQIWEAVRKVLGHELEGVLGSEALDYVAAWPYQQTLNGSLRNLLLRAEEKEAFCQLIDELIPSAADMIRKMVVGHKVTGVELSANDCKWLECYLSWVSAKDESKPVFDTWCDLSPDQKLAFSPTIYC